MKKNVQFILSLLLIFSICLPAFAQELPMQDGETRISLLTVSPGEELYSTFGHSAIRVRTEPDHKFDYQRLMGSDIVYNYGTFDFDDPDFYMKFIRGKLKYYVSTEDFIDFKNMNAAENRGIKEQVLDFTTEEKHLILLALQDNAKEENKFYLYDFFLDNCTTRLRDIMARYHQPFNLPAVMPVHYTFRNAIHQYLDANNKQWSKLGIDILLGAPTDAVMTPAQQEFLPDNLMLALDKAKKTTHVSDIRDLYLTDAVKNEKSFFTPMILFTAILLLFILLSLIKNDTIRRILSVMDGLLFFSVGLLGILLVLMWVATDHSMTKNNYNILWAWPFHIVYAFFMHRKTARVITYSKIAAVFLVLLLCCWHFLAQEMNNALIPVVLLLIFRSGKKGFSI